MGLSGRRRPRNELHERQVQSGKFDPASLFLKKIALTNDPRRILEILEESDEDQSNSTSDAEVEDHLSERSNDSGTEQQVSDSDAEPSNLDLLTLQSQQNRHVFKGRDGNLYMP
ncbi:unnamed protein product [Danaus chrysippus]|uniref:(African queen) hypothetical protein n=1 Tax=Danaus chrysippus TaxID=151541 RepID=A0A8J2QNW4_9NEOP|nr:unnamed protein product [Danaus chrysippus]